MIPPALTLLIWLGERTRRRLLTQFVDARLLPALTAGLSPARRTLRHALVLAAAVLLLLALARPQYGFDKEDVQLSGLDIVVAVDTSKSMLAADIAPDRLSRAKLLALELMQTAKADRLGLVAFAGDAFLACPLTIDDTAFQQSVQGLDVKAIPQGGTALAAAVRTALTAFKEKGNHKALVLLTDGEDNDEGALEAAQQAAKEGLKIFTIGIGSAEGTLVQLPDGNGGSDYIRDDKGQVVKTKLNEALLRQMAEAAGGFYLPLRGADTVETLYERGLAPLPKAEGKEKQVRRYHEQFHWPLGAAVLLLLLEILMPERKRDKMELSGDRPHPGPLSRERIRPNEISRRESLNRSSVQGCSVEPVAQTASRRLDTTPHGLLAFMGRGKRALVAGIASALMAFMLLGLAEKSPASPPDALRDYRAGNFTNALTEYTRLAEVRTNDLRLVFNAGDAAYRATNFDLAEKLFQQVTLSPDLKLQQPAFYNLGNVRFQKAKQAKDLDGLEQGFEDSAKIYEHAVRLNTNDADAGFNLSFARFAAQQIREIKAAFRQAKGSADEAVRRAEFHRALAIMQQLTEKYKINDKPFEQFTKKLKDIDDIATPHQP